MAKKIIIELPDKCEDVLSITAIGSCGINVINASVGCFDLSKGKRITYDGSKWLQSEVEAEHDTE